MRYMPAVDLTPQVRLMLARGALALQPGQWVRGERGAGRYLRTDLRTGVTYVSWVRPGDTFAAQAGRFGRACRKGYVGRHGRRYRPREGTGRPGAGDAGRPSRHSAARFIPSAR